MSSTGQNIATGMAGPWVYIVSISATAHVNIGFTLPGWLVEKSMAVCYLFSPLPGFHLVGGLNPSEKYESQLGWLFPTEWENKIDVPNHQLVPHWHAIVGTPMFLFWFPMCKRCLWPNVWSGKAAFPLNLGSLTNNLCCFNQSLPVKS